ncbi:MAG TPA: hypothetical protein ACFYD5_05595, partial [Candidatus Tripitaka sp. YC43]
KLPQSPGDTDLHKPISRRDFQGGSLKYHEDLISIHMGYNFSLTLRVGDVKVSGHNTSYNWGLVKDFQKGGERSYRV